MLTQQPPSPVPPVEQASPTQSSSPNPEPVQTPPNPFEQTIYRGPGPVTKIYHRESTPEAECDAELQKQNIAKGELVLEIKKPSEPSDTQAPLPPGHVPMPVARPPVNGNAASTGDDPVSWEPLSGREILIGQIRDAAEKYFKNNSLVAPPTPSHRTNELWEYEQTLQFMMSVIHTREKVVDAQGKILSGTQIDFRSLGVLFPEEFGAGVAQKELASGDGRGHLARLQSPEFKAPIADIERLMRRSLEDLGRGDLANDISVDGKVALPTTNDAELSAVEKFQRLSLARGGTDRRVGLGTIDSVLSSAERRDQAKLRDEMLGRDEVIKETVGRTMELRAFSTNLEQRLALQNSQTQELRFVAENTRATEGRERLISNLESIIGSEHMEDRGYLRRLVEGLSAVLSLGKNSFAKDELDKEKKKNEESFKTSYAREYEQFIGTHNFVRGKSSETIFLQTRAAELLEHSRQRIGGAENFQEERGRVAELRIRQGTPRYHDGRVVNEVSGIFAPQASLKPEQQLKEMVESLTKTKRFGFLRF